MNTAECPAGLTRRPATSQTNLYELLRALPAAERQARLALVRKTLGR